MKIGFHPYTYVRANVMRSKLLKEGDYAKLMKMSVPEITKYLQERHFKEEINALGAVHDSTELIERALMNNLNRSFTKLKRIMQGNLSIIVDAYLERFDVENAKTVLRGVKTDQREKARDLIFDIGSRSRAFYEDVLDADTVAEALERLEELDIVSGAGDISVVENRMERNYYLNLLDTCEGVRGAERFEDFVKEEILVTNVLTVLRLTKEGMDESTIKELLIPGEGMTDDLLGRSLEEILDGLRETKFADAVPDEYEDSLIPIERELQRYLLRKSVLFLHQDILSVNVILGYMFAKELEIRNLRALVKGKRLGVSDEFIKEELIV